MALQLASWLALADPGCDVRLVLMKCKGQCCLILQTGLQQTELLIFLTDFQDSRIIMGWFPIMRAIQEV